MSRRLPVNRNPLPGTPSAQLPASAAQFCAHHVRPSRAAGGGARCGAGGPAVHGPAGARRRRHPGRGGCGGVGGVGGV
eukprot:366427-Chlamydomonas_euryale.AAC.2